MTLLKSAIIFFSACIFSVAHASPNHDLSPKHGGIVSESKDVTLELVAKANTVTVYVRDHGKSVSTAKLKGKLVSLSGATRSEYILEPVNDTLSAANVSYLEKGTVLLVTISGYEGKIINARFSLK